MSAPTNPPKAKTLERPFALVPYEAQRAITAMLVRGPKYALAVWSNLVTHATGFEIESPADFFERELGAARSSFYQAIACLKDLGLLLEDAGRWILRIPEKISESVRTDSARSEGRVRAGAGTTLEKDKPQRHTEKRSHVVATSDRGRVGMSKKTKKDDRDKPEPVKAQPNNAPDNHGRELVSCLDRVSLEKFLGAWSSEFRDGPNGRNLIILPSAWQQRILWIWQYWTADEMREAFIATRDATPRNAWRYFCRCLEKIADGTWADGRQGPDTVRYIGGTDVDRDPDRLADEELEAADVEAEPDDPDEAAYRRGEITLEEWFERRVQRGRS